MRKALAERISGLLPSGPPIKSPGPGGAFRCRALDIALGVLIAAVPLAYYRFAPYTLKWAVLGFFTPLIAFLWLWGGCGRPFRPLPKLVPPLLVLLLVAELSLPHALNLYYGLQQFIFLLILFLLYLTVVYTCVQSENQEKLARYLLLTLLAVSALSLAGCPLGYFTGPLAPAESLFRLFGNTNYGAAYLLTVVPLSLAVYFGAARPWEKAVWGSALFLAVMLLTLSMVRGAWVSILVGFGVLLWVFSRGKQVPGRLLGVPRSSMVSGALLIGLAIVVGSLLSPVCLSGSESLGHRVASMFDLGTPSLQIRLAVWEGTLRLIRDHLWTGVGIGNFTFAFVPYRLAAIYRYPGVRIEHPHNEFLGAWAELGPLGLMVLLWLLVRVLRLGWRQVGHTRGRREVLAGVLGGLAASVAYANLFYVGHLPASAMNTAILLGMLDAMDREVGPEERGRPVRLAPLLAGLLVMLLLGFEYFLRPLAGEVHYWLAEKSIAEKRIKAGLSRFDRSLEWDPHSYQARYRQAVILYAMRRYPEAIRGTEMAIKIHPNMDVAYGLMGSAYLNLGEKTKAKEIFQQALALNPNYPDGLNNLGVLAAQEGRIAEAEAMFLHAKEILGRTEMKPYANLGNLYEMTGRMKEALRMFETAVAIRPKSGSTWYRVARLRVLNDNPRGAYPALARAIRLNKKWGTRAAKDPAFEAVRRRDLRVRTLLQLGRRETGDGSAGSPQAGDGSAGPRP